MRLTWAEINLDAIGHNLQMIKQRVGSTRIVAIVKANAYGHGIVRVARKAVVSGADYLGVGFLEEGLLLRKRGFKIPILVLGGVLFHQVDTFLDNDLDITVSSLGLAYAVNNAVEGLGKKARIHLKFDTGFNRIGIHHEKAPLVFERLRPLKNIDIVGIYSHMSTSDEANSEFAHSQIKRFKNIIESANAQGIDPEFKHIACSSAIQNYPEAFWNMVRVGLAMYGLYPSIHTPRTLNIEPVLSFKSRVVFLKTVGAGEGVSYGRRYFTDEPSRLVTIPVGYGDGFNRALSNNGDVLIRGKRYPIVGSVCMDQIMVNIGQNTTIAIGDEVVLYGRQGNEEIRVEEIAHRIGTIPYEVTTWLARRIPRVCLDGSRSKPK